MATEDICTDEGIDVNYYRDIPLQHSAEFYLGFLTELERATYRNGRLQVSLTPNHIKVLKEWLFDFGLLEERRKLPCRRCPNLSSLSIEKVALVPSDGSPSDRRQSKDRRLPSDYEGC
jgi:hypothetical protein